MSRQWDNLPGSANAWEEMLIRLDGPIILRGEGLGAAASFVSHSLLVGVDQARDVFSYLDPLRGNHLQTEDCATMLAKIARPYVYATADIRPKLQASGKYFTMPGIANLPD